MSIFCSRSPRNPDRAIGSYRRRVLVAIAFGVFAGAFGYAGAVQAADSGDQPKINAVFKGDLDGMVERRYIRILVVMNKTNYFLDKGKPHGTTYEASHAFEEFVNQKLGSKTLKVNVALLPVSRDELLPALVAGKGDIAAANLTITPERLKEVDFGAPLVKGVTEVLVTHKSYPPVATLDDLSGTKVWVRPSSSFHASLLQQNGMLEKSGKKSIRVMPADERLEDEDVLEMVNANLIPATFVDDHIATFWAGVFDDIVVHSAITVRTGGEIAWAIRKNSPQLKTVVDEFSRTHGKGTLFGNVLLKRYLKDNKWVKNPAAREEIARFNSLLELFRAYGDKYDLPWLLVAAQAYQESGIDQAKKNPSGAVGVMQIKPTTAAGKPILIEGVDESAERNIEAGAKYLRFIVDQYYADEPMDKLDKGLFAVASYNAGPARIARLRKKAQEMGLDPNRWFGNVEVAVANDIGRETVQYVSNIYKYYVTYNLLLAERADRDAAKAAGVP